jgi:CRP-like cAMP-binding protein
MGQLFRIRRTENAYVPKAMSYKPNSVIYFEGDVADRIFILKSGRVSLNSTDIETGQEVHELIKTGEFFGVKSALGKYPREESARVLSDTQVLMFSVPEFEQLVMNNTRIIMKMLKVFSNQLRRIHTKVSNLLAYQEQVDQEKGLFSIGEYYLKKKQYSQALYALQKYKRYYPRGRFLEKADEYEGTAERYAQKYGSGKGPAISGLSEKQQVSPPSSGGSQADEGSPESKKFYDAMSLFSRQQYQEAIGMLKELAQSAPDEEYRVKALFEIGRSLFYLKQYDATIRHLTGFAQKYSRVPELPEVLFYIGQAYEKKDETERAGSFYQKALSMAEDGDTQRKIKKALRELKEGVR